MCAPRRADRRARHRSLHGHAHGARHSLAQRAHIGGSLNEALRDNRLHIRPREGLLADQHLVEHAAERVEIAPSIYGFAHRLLGTHVRGRPDVHPHLREAGAVNIAERLPDAEVGNERVAAVEEDVLGLDVTMHHAVPVRVLERARHLTHDTHGVLHRQLRLRIEQLAQRLSVHCGHHVEQNSVNLARIEERDDVGMVEPRGELDLAQKAIGTHRVRHVFTEHLERDVAAVLHVVREIHRRHPALPELALDAIAAGERGSEARERRGHLRPLASCSARSAGSRLKRRHTASVRALRGICSVRGLP
jgi:hypothetical protein